MAKRKKSKGTKVKRLGDLPIPAKKKLRETFGTGDNMRLAILAKKGKLFVKKTKDGYLLDVK